MSTLLQLVTNRIVRNGWQERHTHWLHLAILFEAAFSIFDQVEILISYFIIFDNVMYEPVFQIAYDISSSISKKLVILAFKSSVPYFLSKNTLRKLLISFHVNLHSSANPTTNLTEYNFFNHSSNSCSLIKLERLYAL